MRWILVSLLCWLACVCLSAEDIDLPEGFELADLEEPIQENDSRYASTEDDSPALAILEANPSAIVANCVNAVSGTFFDSQVDLMVPGPVPLVVQRVYSSSDKEWHFQHIPLLKTGPSKSGRHLNAGYQDDSGSGMIYQAQRNENSLRLPSSVFKYGLTNCSSDEISGQTNWKNSALYYVRDDKEKMYLLRHGSHVDRVFKRYKRYGKHHHQGTPWGEFHLWKEFHPNGNQLHYEYDEDDQLIKIKAVDHFGKSFGELNRSGDHWFSLSGNVHYTFEGKKLLSAQPSHAVHARYLYNNERLCQKNQPDGRFLIVDYYESGSGKGKVQQLLAPVGIGNTPVVTHTFTYQDNITIVKNVYGHPTQYFYDKDHQRLESIVKYDINHQIHSIDKFFWGADDNKDQGNLLTRTFQGDGKIHFCKKFYYDSFGNIISEQLYGHLTGKPMHPLKVDALGNPKGGEFYVKTYSFSQDGWNLPQMENDGRKKIISIYYPKSNRLKHRFTQTDKVLKREFFEYDDNGVVIKETWDDGISQDPEDLTGVTERHVKVITPTSLFPVGLPRAIEEGYLDIKTHTYLLLKKTINAYSPEGRVKKQTHFGSDGKLAYVLEWEYDTLGNVTKHIDALGQVSTYKYDDNGNKIFEQGPLIDFHKEFTYDLANRLIQEKEIWSDGTQFLSTHQHNPLNQRTVTTDPYGHTTYYSYDAQGHLIKTQFPAIYNEKGEQIIPEKDTLYDAMDNMIAHIDANGSWTRKEYTIRGQPCCIKYPDGSVERKEYTLDGLLEREIAKNGILTIYQHDAFGRVIRTEIRDSQNQLLKSTSAIYSTFQLLSETNAEGVVTTYEYDGAGRRILMKKGNHLTHYAYDPLGNLTKTIEFLHDGRARITVQEYDLLGRVIEERIEDDTGQLFKREQSYYDAIGNRTHHIKHVQADLATTITEYNPQGKPTKITDALGHATHFTYDYAYWHQGQQVLKVTKTDPLGNQEVTIYNTHSKVSNLLRYNSLGLVTQSESYVYDPVGQQTLSKIDVYSPEISHAITTCWEYDSIGNVTHCVEAKGASEEKNTRIFFNSYGQKEKITKPDGINLYHEYDALGRLSCLRSSDQTVHYTYAYDLQDHPIEIQDQIQKTKTQRSYDEYGCLLSETLDTGDTLTYSYDALDRLLTLTLPDHSCIRYHYNAHHLIAVDRVKNEMIYTHRYIDYDLAENPLKEQLIAQAGSLSRQYDLLQRMTYLQAPFWQETIPPDGYNPAGNLLKRQVEDVQGRLIHTYAYDDLYQLISETGISSHIYKNDSVYNRITKDGKIYPVNTLNQITDDDYRYDANGNLIQYGSKRLRYDALDRLVEVEDDQLTTYAYDSFHRRISKKFGDVVTHYLYEGQNEIGAIENNRLIQLRVLGNCKGAEIGSAVAVELQGVCYIPIHDSLGNIVALLDLSGRLTENYRYTAFGEIQVYGNSSLDNPWRYCSKRYDLETGFIYFGRRYYSPEIGRWITPDPAGFVDGPNLYAYVHNHPLAYTDPDGQFAFFLVPIAISLAAEYCLPAATALLQQYAGGLMAAGFLTGMVQGYNGSVFDPSAFAHADMSSYLCERAGMCLGTILSLNPGKIVATKGAQLITGTVTRELSGAALNVAAKKSQKAWSWFSHSLTRRVQPSAQMAWAKNVPKKCNATGTEQFTKEIKYTRSSLELGQKMHKAYKADDMFREGVVKEFRGIPNIRPDFVDFNTKTIYELKPFNPRAIEKGTRQLKKYKSLFEQHYGNNWQTILDTY